MTLMIKNRHRLKKRDIDDILEKLKKTFPVVLFTSDASVETGTLEEFNVILVNGTVDFFILDENIFFTLHGLSKFNPKEHRVVIDMGAIRFVAKGADIMAPGITDADQAIQENDQVWVCDETYHKPLAIGIALMNGEKMKIEKRGKAIHTVHYVGDRLWNLSKNSP